MALMVKYIKTGESDISGAFTQTQNDLGLSLYVRGFWKHFCVAFASVKLPFVGDWRNSPSDTRFCPFLAPRAVSHFGSPGHINQYRNLTLLPVVLSKRTVALPPFSRISRTGYADGRTQPIADEHFCG